MEINAKSIWKCFRKPLLALYVVFILCMPMLTNAALVADHPWLVLAWTTILFCPLFVQEAERRAGWIDDKFQWIHTPR